MENQSVVYRLENAEERNHIYSTTFRIPSREKREEVQIRDLVKLIFTVEESGNTLSERLWVKVCRKGLVEPDAPLYGGVVTSNPAILKDIIPSDKVDFDPEHICDIVCPSPEKE